MQAWETILVVMVASLLNYISLCLPLLSFLVCSLLLFLLLDQCIPGRFSSGIFVNQPFYYSWLYKAVKPLMSEKMSSRVSLLFKRVRACVRACVSGSSALLE